MSKSKGPNLPWVEKYRPAKLDDLISHEDIIATISKFIKEDQLPHLLFYGPPGTGKTSTILACAKQLYSPNQINSMVLELNASDDRGIGIVRGQILSFASTRTIFNTGFKLIILDEADAMTNDAQNALRRTLDAMRIAEEVKVLGEKPALVPLCPLRMLHDLTWAAAVPRITASVNITEDGKKALLTLAQGDMRKALNILQSTSMAYKEVTENNVYTCVGHPLKSDISNIVKWLLNEEFSSAYKKIQDLKTAKGLALQDILTEVHLYIHRIELPSPALVGLIIKMADIENRLASGTNENIQLSALLSAFITARDMVPVDTES